MERYSEYLVCIMNFNPISLSTDSLYRIIDILKNGEVSDVKILIKGSTTGKKEITIEELDNINEHYISGIYEGVEIKIQFNHRGYSCNGEYDDGKIIEKDKRNHLKVLFLEIDKYLKNQEKITKYIPIFVNSTLGIVLAISMVIVLLNFFFNIIGEFAKIARPIAGISIITLVILNPLFFYFIYKNKFINKEKGFFKENRNAILMLIVAGIISLIFTVLGLFIQKHLKLI